MELTLQALDATFSRFVAFLPTLLTAAVVLAVGWIVAILLARITDAVLERVGFDALVQRGKVHETIGEDTGQFDPSRVVGSIVFWAVLITTFLLTSQILGLTAISILLTRLVAFLPFVAVAVIAIVVAVALAQIAYEAIITMLGDRIEGTVAVASVAKWSIIAFGVFVALSQLQIAPVIVNGLFLAVVGALALAFAVSFGWGNVELAKEITGHWYHRTIQESAAAKRRELREPEDKGKRPAA